MGDWLTDEGRKEIRRLLATAQFAWNELQLSSLGAKYAQSDCDRLQGEINAYQRVLRE